MPSSDDKSGADKARTEEIRRQLVRNIPQKLLIEMSGRQNKQINEQARRYKLPFGGPTIDLFEFFPAFFDFLADNARKLRGAEPSLDGVPRNPGERKMLADARRAEHKLAVETAKVIPKAEAEQWVMDAVAYHARILDSMTGKLAVRLGGTLAERRRVLKDFATKSMADAYGRTKG